MTDDYSSILVIDDEEDLLEMVARLLRLDGYEVSTAKDGQQGLAMIEEHMPDLVLLDIMMPGIDGVEVLAVIREQSDVPVIMLSAKAEMSSMCRTLDLGADDYVTKPFGLRELRARIRAKLRRKDFQTDEY